MSCVKCTMNTSSDTMTGSRCKNTVLCWQEEAERVPLTPEELALEKQRAQQLQEESDLLLAKEAFGIYITTES